MPLQAEADEAARVPSCAPLAHVDLLVDVGGHGRAPGPEARGHERSFDGRVAVREADGVFHCVEDRLSPQHRPANVIPIFSWVTAVQT